MNSTDYRELTTSLQRRLETEPDVLGLVAVGSMSGVPPAADEWSDHDFFVVTRPGAQERFRTDLGWLPRSGGIALAFRETAHGVKVVWDDGHLAEFAVFDLGELGLARVNRAEILFDRGGVAERVAQVRASTVERVAASHQDDLWLCGQLLTALLVGAGRFRRGERLAGHRSLTSAVEHLLVLLGRHVATSPGALDDLDPFRRVELAYPGLAAELATALRAEPPDAARAILALARRELLPVLPVWPERACQAVAKLVVRSSRADGSSGQSSGGG